jgi:signal transduction histidine kinase
MKPRTAATTSVHQLVSQLITSLQPLAVRRNNLLLNDIPRDLNVDIDKNTLAYMLTRLVNTAVESTENMCIHIEAVPAGENTMIRVKDLNTYIYHTMGLPLEHEEPLMTV